MRRAATACLILALFAVVAGRYAARAWLPIDKAEFPVGGVVEPMQEPAAQQPGKNLYFRRTWEMPRPPQYAWLQVLGHDHLEAFVNGTRVGKTTVGHGRSTAALAVDITRLLRPGKNSIAINAQQRMLHRPPALDVQAGYVLSDGIERQLGDPQAWRFSNHYDRQGTFWYAVDFDDSRWARPAVGARASWRAMLDYPAKAVTTAPKSQWITPSGSPAEAAVFRREFQIDGMPRQGWVRLTTTGPYRLAVNGVVVADDGETLAAPPPFAPKRQLMSIGPFLRPGANVVAVSVSTPGESPHINADLHFETRGGGEGGLATDGTWMTRGGYVRDWLAPVADPALWAPCVVEDGDVGVIPWKVEPQVLPVEIPAAVSLARAGVEALATLVAGMAALLGVLIVGRMMDAFRRPGAFETPNYLPHLALFLPTVAGAAGIVMTYDSAISERDVYSPLWLAGLWSLAVGQWMLLILLALGGAPQRRLVPADDRMRRWAVAGALALLFAAGLWLRVRDILAEPVHHDEVGAYWFTVGVWEYGFPGGQIHPDVPFGYCATSELVYFFNAPFALLLDHPLLVLRVPAVAWSMATLLLIYYVGSRLFNRQAALLAAAIYALSPYAIGMANFGRYFSQLQFFALLSTYFFYETIRGEGPINRRALWLTAISFSAMFLSWEGSGFLAPGMALAALVYRRGRLGTIFREPSIYAAMIVVGLVFLAQNAHRTFQQTQRLWYGTGISDLALTPMWRYQIFFPDFYFKEASWIQDSFLPMMGLLLAVAAALRSRFQGPLRVILIIFLCNCGAMMALLPLRSGRYSYHLMPLLILACSAALALVAHQVASLGRAPGRPLWARGYGKLAAGAALAAFLALSCGHWVATDEMASYATTGYRANVLRFPDWDGPMQYVRDHYQEGDVIISMYPHAIDFVMYASGDPRFSDHWRSDYWLQSTMVLQSTLGDSSDLPRDRRAGTVMIPDRERLEHLFKHKGRIWYCTLRRPHNQINDADVSEYLRQHMDVVYEDFRTSVLLRDARHRPASVREADERMSEESHESYFN